MSSWGVVYNRYLRRGHDHGSAAFAAEQWEKRKHKDRWKNCPSTHCERRGECASPNECSARILGRPEPETIRGATVTDKLVEKVARAMLEAQGYNPDVAPDGDGVPWCHDYKPEARAAILVVRAALVNGGGDE